MTLTLQQLNNSSENDVVTLLGGLYERAPWVVQQALTSRPFRSLTEFKYAMTRVVTDAGHEAQTALVRAQREITDLPATVPTTRPTGQTGLSRCSVDELSKVKRLCTDYRDQFGFPFILALPGPRGAGLSPTQIVATLERRLREHPADELSECVRNLHRAAELTLNHAFDAQPELGNRVWDWCEELARLSEPDAAAKGQLTVTYLTPTHRACSQSLCLTFRNCGFDEVHIDAVGNVVGRYRAQREDAPALLTGSHFDTVRHAGKYDGRLGIFVPAVCVQELARRGRRLPFAIELVAFAEKEGQRYQTRFLGSSALTGQFGYRWLAQRDANRINMRDAMEHAGLVVDDIPAIARNPKNYLGFVEVHIEQGPVLNRLNIPLGVVTSVNGGVRYVCVIEGAACHAGTTPMAQRRDAATAAAELTLYVERRATETPHLVGTVGLLATPGGSVNVVPGRCEFSLDLRAPTDGQRDSLASDVLRELAAICERRGVRFSVEETSRVNAAPSAPAWQRRWEIALADQGAPLHRMSSGAGHDAMTLHSILPQAMLFVRGQNGGISHSPLESTTSDDMQLAVRAFTSVLEQLATDNSATILPTPDCWPSHCSTFGPI
jgi:N-carbamoyl-L-amino-acid hydrolase